MERREVTDAVMETSRVLVGVAARSIADVSDEVTLAQYRVLVIVDSHEGLTMGELADALGVSPSTATRVCDALEDKEYLHRSPSSDSGRVVCTSLTRAGRDLVRRSFRQRRRLLDAAVARLSPDAQRRLAKSLREFTDALGHDTDHGENAWALGWPDDNRSFLR